MEDEVVADELADGRVPLYLGVVGIVGDEGGEDGCCEGFGGAAGVEECRGGDGGGGEGCGAVALRLWFSDGVAEERWKRG